MDFSFYIIFFCFELSVKCLTNNYKKNNKAKEKLIRKIVNDGFFFCFELLYSVPRENLTKANGIYFYATN